MCKIVKYTYITNYRQTIQCIYVELLTVYLGGAVASTIISQQVWLTGNLSRVYHAARPMTAGVGSSTLLRINGMDNGWMDGLYTCVALACISDMNVIGFQLIVVMMVRCSWMWHCGICFACPSVCKVSALSFLCLSLSVYEPLFDV